MQIVLKKPSLTSEEKDLIKTISKYKNVPRKKTKFVNFLIHAFRQYANKSDLVERIWDEVEGVFKELTNSEHFEIVML